MKPMTKKEMCELKENLEESERHIRHKIMKG